MGKTYKDQRKHRRKAHKRGTGLAEHKKRDKRRKRGKYAPKTKESE